jgi:two-component system cell cycle response regulator DivK
MQHDAANWTVLIVDDEPDNLNVVQKILSYYGARVFTALDGYDGLEVLSGVKPTVILLDLAMPNMNGWEMLRLLRANPDTAATPVIALTAHAMRGDRERALRAGFDAYIAKPFRLESLMSDVSACISDGRSSTN